jgi:hypothetical protein
MSKKSSETEFQIRLENVDRKKIVDFTEKKLLHLSKTMEKASEREACATLLGMYVAGDVAIRWVNSQPRYIKVPKK